MNPVSAISWLCGLGNLSLLLQITSGRDWIQTKMVQLITLKNGLFDCFPGEEGVSVLQMTVEGGLDQGVEVED